MLIDINLLPKKTRRPISFMFIPIGVASVLLVVFLVMFLHVNGLKQEEAELNQKVERTTELLATMEANNVEVANSAQTLEQYVEWLDNVQFSTVKMLDDLVSRLPERGYFMEYAFDGNETVTIMVQFDQLKEVSHYLHELNASENVVSASVLTVTTTPLVEDAEEDVLPRYVTGYEIVVNKDNLRADEEEIDG